MQVPDRDPGRNSFFNRGTKFKLDLQLVFSEAPGTAKDRLADDTDLYAFVSKDAPDKVTFVDAPVQ